MSEVKLELVDVHISEVQKLLQVELDNLDEEISTLESKKEKLLSAFNTINDLVPKQQPQPKGSNGFPKKINKSKTTYECVSLCGKSYKQEKRWKDHKKICFHFLNDLEKKSR